jgi:hypothetical protein
VAHNVMISGFEIDPSVLAIKVQALSAGLS